MSAERKSSSALVILHPFEICITKRFARYIEVKLVLYMFCHV
jgi:hypothetical protein